MEEKKKIDGKKEIAVIRTLLQISRKQARSIIKFIQGKKVDDAISILNRVIKKKIAVPMKGEIPHRKGIAGGRFPVKASALFIKLLKGLSANASQKGIEGDLVISGKTDTAPKAMRPGRFRHHFKRINVELRLEKK